MSRLSTRLTALLLALTVLGLSAFFLAAPSLAQSMGTERSIASTSAESAPLSDASTPEEVLARAWQLAEQSGSYHYRTTLDQITYPAPSIENAGRVPEEAQIGVEGWIDLPQERLEMTLWPDASFDPQGGISVRVENGESFGRTGEGAEWEPLDGVVDGLAPGGDPLGFLAAASEIEYAGETTSALTDRTFDRYTFVVDGPQFAEHMRGQFEQQLRQRGELPAGMSVDTASIYARMTGTGELWVRKDGLPAHLELAIALPGEDAQRTEATLTNEYWDFDEARLVQAGAALWAHPTDWLAVRAESGALAQVSAMLMVLLMMGLFLFFVVTHRESRGFYTAFVIAVIGTMLSGPLMQGNQVYAATTRQLDRQARQDEGVREAAQHAEMLSHLQQPTTDPHQDPMTAPTLESPQVEVATAAQSAPAEAPSLREMMQQNPSTDSDGDGLSDTAEAEWMTCAYLLAPEYCDDVADPTDSDGDGLSDGTEVYRLTTDPARADSDGDGITDDLEVNGFSYDNQMWYLNPTEVDSNRDGLIDAQECPLWTAASTGYDPSAGCPDTDGDGTPNPWDDDNDGDGVVDAVDSSPDTVALQTYDADNPMELQVDGLQADEPVFVDLQLRPTETDHLYYIGNVLDWPSDDTLGQIQRRLDTTFADTENLDIRSSDALAGNGDVRLTPLLEIQIPYTAGHYGNLPVKSDYQNTPRTLDMVVADWLDTEALEPYGITVRDADDGSGDLFIYAPIGSQVDDTGGGRAALTTRMLYWPTQTGSSGSVEWGSAHQFRVQWLVQRLQDDCADADDLTTCTETMGIIHIYDESWTATGLTIQEDHGLEVEILYEDPSQDGDLSQEQDLWPASWYLNNNFVSGRDCDTVVNDSCQGDGERDITVATMNSVIDTWSGGEDVIESQRFSYDHHGFMALVNMTETVSLLESTFEPAGIYTPTLLFARETTARHGNLADAPTLDGTLVVDMSDAAEMTTANLGWSTFEYDGSSWQTMDALRGLDLLRLQLQEQDYYQPTDDSQQAEDEANGKLLWAELYYASMRQGMSAAVAIDGAVLWDESHGEMTRDDFEPPFPTSTFKGASYVNFVFIAMLKTIADKSASWADVWEHFERPYFTNHLLARFPRMQTAGTAIMGVTTAAAVTGFALFAVGYLSGDQQLQRTGEIVLNATAVVVTTIALANFITGLIAAQQAGQSLTAFSSANRAMGPAGMILGVVAIWGGMAYFAYSSGLLNNLGGIEFNLLLAFAVAQTLVLLILIAISLIPIVGQILTMLIVLTDAIASFFGEKGAQGYLTTVIAESLYDVDMIIRNFDNPNRLTYDFVDMVFADEALSYTTEQEVTYSVDVTTTLNYKEEHGPSEGKKSTFRYYLQKEPLDPGVTLKLRQMQDEWSNIQGNNIRAVQSATMSDSLSLGTVGVGINRNLGGHLFLTEAYAAPYVGCWQLVGAINTDCTTYAYTGLSHIDIGEYHVFDILPDSLTGLYQWMNGSQFPQQQDADGDGLLRGTDPGLLTWDSDGDTLSDYFELSQGTNPTEADSDQDGLTDAEEIRRGLNPNSNDGDNDGLSDLIEWEGWQVSYGEENGTSLLTWAWPDPASPDYDLDSLDDQEEYLYALHPRLASNVDEILETIQFSDGTLVEEGSPVAQLRFEERAGALTFVDNARDERAHCSLAACPIAGAEGRYGRGLTFDGTGDYLEMPFVLDPAAAEFTAAAWIRPEAPDGEAAIISQKDGQAWLTIGSSGILGSDMGGFNNPALTFGEWYHVAVVYDGSWVYVYLNGAYHAASNVPPDAHSGNMMLGARVQFGVLQQSSFYRGEMDEVVLFDRALSEAELAELMAGRTNTNDAIVTPGTELDVTMTISNANPVRAADVVYYQDGDINFTTVFTHTPYAYLPFDEGAGATSFAASYSGGSADCDTSFASCPTAGVAGVQGNGVEFNGNTMLRLDSLLQNYNQVDGFTFGFWMKPADTSSGKYDQVVTKILDGSSGTYQLDVRQALRDDHFNSTLLKNQVYAPNVYGPVVSPGEWAHVGVTVDAVRGLQHLYVNGLYYDSRERTPNGWEILNDDDIFYLGGLLDHAPTERNFHGVIDEFILYDRLLDADDMQALYEGQQQAHSQIVNFEPPELLQVGPLATEQLQVTATIPADQPAGSYHYRQLAEAALQIPNTSLSLAYDPVLRVHFDEKLQGPFPNDFSQRKIEPYPGGETLYCSVSTSSPKRCPDFVRDMAGAAISLDGVNQAVSYDVAAAQGGSAWTIALWINPAHTGDSNRAIAGGDNGFPALYLNNDDQLALSRNNGGTWQTYPGGGTVPRDQWSHVAATHDGAGNYRLYLNSVPVMEYVGLGQFSGSASGHMGRIASSPFEYFQGKMDNFTIYNVALDDDEIAALASQSDLSLHLHMPFDDAPGSSTLNELTGIFGDATCNANSGQCPLLGIRTMSNRGAFFDGDLLQSTLPDYWMNEFVDRNGLTFAAWLQLTTPEGYLVRAPSGKPAFEIQPFKVGGNLWHMREQGWAHLVVSLSTQNALQGVWLDGVQVSDDTGWLYNDGSGTQPLKIGGDTLSGYMDDLRLYDRGFSHEEAVALYQNSTPQLQFEFEEGAVATEFEDTSPNDGRGLPDGAIAGLAGRVGNGVTLNGEGYVEIADTTALDALTDNFTLMAWVRPEDDSQKQWIVAPAQTASSNGFGLGIENGTLFFETFGNGGLYSSAAPIAANQWQHVALVFDSLGQLNFYVDGVLQDTLAASASALANGDDPYLVGATTASGSTAAVDAFDGAIDELLVYSYALSAAAVESAYINQFRWFRQQFDAYLNVDTDDPTIELLTTQTYWPNSYVSLAVATDDASSTIYSFDVGLQAPGESSMTWQGALPCQDAEAGVAWCPSFDPTTLGGEGAYQLQFRAVDAVGHQTLSPVHTLYVDDTPPSLTVDSSTSLKDIARDPGSELAWLLPLSGTAADPNIGAVAGSGVYTPSLMVDVFDRNGNSLGGPQQAVLSGDDWSLDYRIPGHRPQGRYTVAVTAADSVGNSDTATVGDGVYLDEQPAEAELVPEILPEYVISDTETVAGIVSELNRWGGDAARYHFEAPQPFADFTTRGNEAACTDCPAFASGMLGQTAVFDGNNDVVTVPHLFDPASDAFSVSLWFNADSYSGFQPRVMVEQLDGAGSGQSLLYLAPDNTLSSFAGGGDATITVGQWHHAAATWDGTTYALYLDGMLQTEEDTAPDAAIGELLLGTDGGSTFFFDGKLDEVIFYNRALLPTEVTAMAQESASGVESVELSLTPVDFATISDTLGTIDTPQLVIPATLDSPSELFSTWEATLDPTGLENYYQIGIDSSDSADNAREGDIVWRGLIDGVPPQISGTGQHIGGGSAAQTEYSITFSDFILDAESLDQMCAASELVEQTYNDALLPHDGLPYEITATCRVTGWESSHEVSACDGAGNCTTATITPATASPADSVAILEPDNGATLNGSSGAIQIDGGAYDLDGIQMIEVWVGGTLLETISGSAATDIPWSVDWMPDTAGTYQISVTMTDSLNNNLTDQIEVTVELVPTSTAIALFEATSLDEGIELAWATVSEETTESFDLYRSTSPEELGEKINAELIPAQYAGLPQGASYTLLDEEVLSGIQYFYTLEVWDVDGSSAFNGPIMGTHGSPTAVTLSGLESGSAMPTLVGALLALLVALGWGWRRRRGGNR